MWTMLLFRFFDQLPLLQLALEFNHLKLELLQNAIVIQCVVKHGLPPSLLMFPPLARRFVLLAATGFLRHPGLFGFPHLFLYIVLMIHHVPVVHGFISLLFVVPAYLYASGAAKVQVFTTFYSASISIVCDLNRLRYVLLLGFGLSVWPVRFVICTLHPGDTPCPPPAGME
jgi:hypothetical protein